MVLLVTNNKGGTGKTAIAVNLCFFFQHHKEPITFLDCDWGQWNGYEWIGDNQKYINVVRLKKEDIKTYKFPEGQHVIIDTPPNFEAWKDERDKIMQWATHMLIPVDGIKAVNPGATAAIKEWNKHHKGNVAIILNRQKQISRLPVVLRKDIYMLCPNVPILGVCVAEGQVPWETAIRRNIPVWKIAPKYYTTFEVILLELESLWHL